MTQRIVAQRLGTWSRAIVLWHLLSLDAPTVAVVWTWAIAASNHLRLHWAALLAMATAVWMLYAADRLLDVRGLDGSQPYARAEGAESGGPEAEGRESGIEARHLFHFAHRRWFRLGIVLASLALAALLPQLAAEAVRLYLILGGLLVGYFVVIHAAPSGLGDATGTGHRLPKELAVGVFFAAAVFIPTVARLPWLRMRLLPEALLLGVLCSLNCLYIYRWEHTALGIQRRLAVHWATRVSLGALVPLTIGVMVLGLGLAAWGSGGWLLPLACSLSGGLLLLVDCFGQRLERTTLHAAADLCLLTPLLLLPWLALGLLRA